MTDSGNLDTLVSDGQLYLAEIYIRMKPVVNDPEGLEILHGLQSLGYKEVTEVRSGKYLRLHLYAESRDDAESRVVQMCERLLANPVIEQYSVTIRETATSS